MVCEHHHTNTRTINKHTDETNTSTDSKSHSPVPTFFDALKRESKILNVLWRWWWWRRLWWLWAPPPLPPRLMSLSLDLAQWASFLFFILLLLNRLMVGSSSAINTLINEWIINRGLRRELASLRWIDVAHVLKKKKNVVAPLSLISLPCNTLQLSYEHAVIFTYHIHINIHTHPHIHLFRYPTCLPPPPNLSDNGCNWQCSMLHSCLFL